LPVSGSLGWLLAGLVVACQTAVAAQLCATISPAQQSQARQVMWQRHSLVKIDQNLIKPSQFALTQCIMYLAMLLMGKGNAHITTQLMLSS
jgi:hypothetical protein